MRYEDTVGYKLGNALDRLEKFERKQKEAERKAKRETTSTAGGSDSRSTGGNGGSR